MSLEQINSSPVIEPEKPKRKQTCGGWACAIIFAVFLAGAGICVGVVYITLQQTVTAIATGAPVLTTAMAESGFNDMMQAFSVVAQESQPVPGDSSHFDPIASLPAVRDYAGDSDELLISIEAHGVRRDGTVDLTTESASYVDYSFQRTFSTIATRAAESNPTSTQDVLLHRSMTIRLSKPGEQARKFNGSSSDTYTTEGMGLVGITMDAGAQVSLADPTCSFADLWDIAAQRDAPASSVATILYDEEGYHFSIDGMSIKLDFNNDCELSAQ